MRGSLGARRAVSGAPNSGRTTLVIIPLHNSSWFGINTESRTSEQVSKLPVESSRPLSASNSVSLQLTPFRGSHSGTKFPEGFPRIAEPPSDLSFLISLPLRPAPDFRRAH